MVSLLLARKAIFLCSDFMTHEDRESKIFYSKVDLLSERGIQARRQVESFTCDEMDCIDRLRKSKLTSVAIDQRVWRHRLFAAPEACLCCGTT